MDATTKSKSRRQGIRKNRPDCLRFDWASWKEKGYVHAASLAAVFFVLTAAILLLRQDVVPYRVGQPVHHDIYARKTFQVAEPDKLHEAQERAKLQTPRVYTPENFWATLEQDLLALPRRIGDSGTGDPPEPLAQIFNDRGVQSLLRNAASNVKQDPQTGSLTDAGLYDQAVHTLIRLLSDYRNSSSPSHPIVLISHTDWRVEDGLRGASPRNLQVGSTLISFDAAYDVEDQKNLSGVVRAMTEKSGFASGALQLSIAEYVLKQLRPTLKLDETETKKRANQAAAAVSQAVASREYKEGDIIVFSRNRPDPYLNESDVLRLRAENAAYLSSLPGSMWKPVLGTTTISLIITVLISGYVTVFQPRIVKNHARAAAIIALLLSTLLIAALVGIGNAPIFLFGVTPTILVAMILAIAYDRRFAIGVASLHGLLVTVALGQTAAFFLILWVGVLVCGFILDDVRTRSKLVEVGGAGAISMMIATCAAGLLSMESSQFVLRNSLYAGAAGLAAGFIVPGILPFVERIFRITTSMTLLELADGSQPLLRRLQLEAPGTYNHSYTVAIMAEAAAEAIGADSLLCRVASYYHDVGKINKPDYFVENQGGGENRHINLDPNLSLLIIVGHVKDGMELAREYKLPNSILPFVQQHHGTTLVEYFYRRACSQQEQRDPTTTVRESQFRYPGPRPRTKEVAILMICDAVESATRALDDPSPAQIEGLVNELTRRRLADGQFDECDITLKDLDRIKRSLVKTLAGIYHGRIPYPPAPESKPSSGRGSTQFNAGNEPPEMRTA